MSQLKTLLTVLAVLLSMLSNGQTNQYWMSQIGARSNMLGGAVVGSVRDNSSIYYNPGGMAFVDNSSLSVMGDAYYTDYVRFENGAGDGIDLKSSRIDATPQFISGIVKSKEKPWLTINYAIFNRGVSRTSSTAQNSGYYDVYKNTGAEEAFHSSIDIYNETREDWAGIGHAYQITDKLGVGVSIFAAFFNQTHREVIDISIVDGKNGNDYANLIGAQQSYNNLYLSNVALLAKFGISYEYENFQFGSTLTLPRMTLKTFSNSNLNRNSYYYIPSLDEPKGKRAYYQQNVSNQYRSPLSIDFGFKIKFNENNKLYFTAAYFASISSYNMLNTEPLANDVDSLLAPEGDYYSTISAANKRILNVAIGYEYFFNENLTMLYGFRTDFNNYDFDQVKSSLEFVPTFSDCDIYHFSGGVNMKQEKFNVSLGLNTSYGFSKNKKQFIDLTSPSEDNFLLGDLTNTVTTHYLRLTMLVGFTYFFGMGLD